MYRIELFAHGTNDYDVFLFDNMNEYRVRYSMVHMSSLQAYIFAIGLVKVFGAGIEAKSANAWEYIMLMHRTETSRN